MAKFSSRATLEKSLQESPTALVPNVPPTTGDISVEKQLNKVKASEDMTRSNALRARWYGPTDPNADKPVERNPGYLERLGNALQVPVNIASGVAEHALGLGTGNLFTNIEENIKSHGTFGDVLRQKGVNPLIAGTAGFGLDVVLDPVNGISGGVAHMAPRIVKGLAEAGTTGAKEAVVSGALMRAENLVKSIIPSYRTVVGQDTAKISDTWMGKLAKLSRDHSDAYDKLTGGGVEALLSKVKERELIYQKVVKAMAGAVGEQRAKIIKAWFKYDDTEWATKKFEESARVFDELSKAKSLSNIDEFGNEIPLSKAARERAAAQTDAITYYHKLQDQSVNEALPVISGYAPGTVPDAQARAMELALEAAKREEEAKALDEALKEFGQLMGNEEKQVKWLNQQTPEVQKEYLAAFHKRQLGGLGVSQDVRDATSGWDKWISKRLMNPVTRNTLRTYDAAIGFFRNAVVGPNIPLHATSILGNFASTNMFGVNTDVTYLKTWKKAFTALYSKDPEAIRGFFGPVWDEVLDKDPEVVRDILGVNPYLLKYGKGLVDTQVDELVKTLSRHGGDQQVIDQAKGVKDLFKKIQADEAEALRRRTRLTSSTTREILPTQELSKGTTFKTQELTDATVTKFLKKLDDAGKKGNKVAAALHWSLTRPVESFGKIDQGHRLATAKHLVENGITEIELRKLSRWMGDKLRPEDIHKSATGNIYYLSPRAALDAASRMYLNYQAMPAFVRLMKHMPIIGHPFLSYQYGMTTNALRAINIDPSWFNKVNFLLQEISGSKTPAEKQALQTKYYDFLNNPGWMKMPWFKNNPMYANMAQFFPQYQVNMLRGQERDYQDRYANAFGAMLDALPAFKGPEGKLLMDYVILPMLLKESLSSTGQQIYPSDASLGEKVGLGASSLISNFVPRSIGAAAAFIPVNPPDQAMEYLPKSYTNVKNALMGRTSIGATSTTDTASSLTAKKVSGELGLPVQEINLKK